MKTLVDEKEEQKGEVDKESYTTTFVCDASHSSSDFYDAKTVDNCSVEALCLDTHMESINNNELEIEPCYTNMQGPELPAMKEEYYEVFPYTGNQGKDLRILYESQILSSQLYTEACSPSLVHQHSLESENLFIYMMSMHRKRVRLRPNSTSRCSKLVCTTSPRVDIPWDPLEVPTC